MFYVIKSALYKSGHKHVFFPHLVIASVLQFLYNYVTLCLFLFQICRETIYSLRNVTLITEFILSSKVCQTC